MRCRSATPRKASPRSASAAAGASPCAWNADRQTSADHRGPASKSRAVHQH
jgi:hypothetical protein